VAKIPTGLWSRGSKLMGLASKLAINELSSRLKGWEDEASKLQSKVDFAHTMVKTLSELKGASMKMGQLLSMDLGEYLPPEVVKVLESLHQNSTFLPFEKISEILQAQLGEKYNNLKELSATPLAAASIGQVHTAILHGQSVVIKIQYPGVAASIPSDLRLLEILLKNLSMVQGKDVNLKPFFQEVEEVLIRETDYLHEAQMLARYKEVFKDSNYIIPQVFTDYSTATILTMERLVGKSLNEWIQKSFLSERQKMAHELMNLYLHEFFHHGLVQTDPNPGNFMITSDNRIGLLDFGAVKEYSKEFIASYKTVLIAAYHRDEKKLLEVSEKINFIDPRESEEAKRIYLDMMNLLAEPFRQEDPFDFTDKKFFEESKNLSWEITRKCKYSPPPKDLLFLHRKLVGIFILIRKLDVKMALKDYWYMVES